MKKQEVVSRIMENGVVAVIRMKDPQRLAQVIEAVRDGGVKCIEITMTVPGAVEVIRNLTATVTDDVLIGAGTVTNAQTAEAVIEAGAQFIVGPVYESSILEVCKKNQIAYLPGCYTPTEIFHAWKEGADIIKVFPATSLGPKYFKDIAGPFPEIRMMPTGGVTVDNVGEWIHAGAVAVGIGSDLLDQTVIEEGRFDVLSTKAARMRDNFLRAKQS